MLPWVSSCKGPWSRRLQYQQGGSCSLTWQAEPQAPLGLPGTILASGVRFLHGAGRLERPTHQVRLHGNSEMTCLAGTLSLNPSHMVSTNELMIGSRHKSTWRLSGCPEAGSKALLVLGWAQESRAQVTLAGRVWRKRKWCHCLNQTFHTAVARLYLPDR